MKKILSLALGIVALLAASGCQEAVTPAAPAPISFGDQPPLRLNVAEIRIIESFQPTLRAPYAEHIFPTPPAMAVKQWAGQRLIAAGSQGALEITLEDASVKETALATPDGVKGFFTDSQSERYDAHIRVTLRLYDGVQTISIAEGTVDVSHMRTVNEKATVAQREQIFQEIVQQMMTQFDREAELRLRQYFSAYLL